MKLKVRITCGSFKGNEGFVERYFDSCDAIVYFPGLRKVGLVGISDMEALGYFNVEPRKRSLTMTQKEFELLPEQVSEYQKENPMQRKGQALFNVLFKNFPEIADTIRATKYDPFFSDEKIPMCYEFVYTMFVA